VAPERDGKTDEISPAAFVVLEVVVAQRNALTANGVLETQPLGAWGIIAHSQRNVQLCQKQHRNVPASASSMVEHRF